MNQSSKTCQVNIFLAVFEPLGTTVCSQQPVLSFVCFSGIFSLVKAGSIDLLTAVCPKQQDRKRFIVSLPNYSFVLFLICPFFIFPLSILLHFLTFPVCFKIPITFSNLNYSFSNLFDKRNLQEQVKKAFCYQILF